MRRVMYLFLPRWPIDRLRRAGLLSGHGLGAQSGKEPPFATVIAAGGRQVLAAVNPAASAGGLAPGMALADALSFLPGLATRPAERAEDAAALRRLAEWCARYSPWTAPDDADGVKIETTGSTHLWGGEAALAADLSMRLARAHGCGGGIAHRLAIANTLGAAWALARFAAAEAAPAIVAPGETRAALAPLPVDALRLDPALAEGLRRVGLTRIGDVLAMPRDAVARRFGDTVASRLDQALGDRPEPLSPLGEVPTRRVRLSLAEPIADPADLARAAERLTLDLVTRLAREGSGARRLDLAFHRIDGRVEHVRLGIVRPSRDPAHLAALLIRLIDTVDPGLGIEDVILSAFAVEPLPAEQIESPLSRADAHAPGGAAPLLDRLGVKLGLDALTRLEPRESHIPERASVAIPASDSPRPPAAGAASSLARPRAPVKPPRPVRLFAPPEPIEAFWLLPDDPPARFAWRHRPHRVTRADGPERIAEEWWRPDGQITEGEGAAGAIRDYYRVEDEAGRRFWMFRAGLPGAPPPRWFIHGIFA